MEKEKIIIIAYDINNKLGSEPGVAYNWVKILSSYYNIIVYTDLKHKKDLANTNLENVEFIYINLDNKLGGFYRNLKLYNLLSRSFAKKAIKHISLRSDLSDIKVIHCLTPAGMYNYNTIYKFNKKFIVGPVGGRLKIPKGLEKYISLKYIVREIYYSVLKLNPFWRNYYKKAYKIIIGLEETKNKLSNYELNRYITVFDTVVDEEYFKPKNEKNNKDFITITYIGKLELLKGCILLLKAYNEIVKKGYKKTKLIFIGVGREEERIKKYIREKNLEDNVILKGYLSQDKVREALQNSDIFSLPTINDNGCGAILEAMACGLPIITADYGGPSISVTEKCGIKIKPKSEQGFVIDLQKALIYLIENEDKRITMGINSRKRIEENFCMSILEKNIVNIYDNL